MSSKLFLIMGATGKTGRNAADMLLERGHHVRAFVHQHDERSVPLQRHGAEIVVGDLHDFMAVRSALEGVWGAYFVYPTQPGILEATASFAQAAKESNVSAIVNLSQMHARREAKSHIAFNHWLAERVFDWSDLPVTHLKPTVFAENLLLYSPGVKNRLVRTPHGESKHAPIAAEDIARAVVSILENPSAHQGKTYRLSGPQEYTYAEMIALISQVLGRPIVYERISREAAREQMSKILTPFEVQHAFETANDHAAGILSGTDEVIEKITGHKPMGVEEFVRKHRWVFA